MRILGTNLGELLRKLRKDAEMTQLEVANILGVPFQFVSNVERGTHTLPVKHWITLSTTFKVEFTKFVEAYKKDVNNAIYVEYYNEIEERRV